MDLQSALTTTPPLWPPPNGRVGIAWYRYLYNHSTSRFNYNVYFAILDSDGNLAYGPTNLTNNAIWGTWGDFAVPTFSRPQIAATGDNRFVLAWQRTVRQTAGYITDVYYAVVNDAGSFVRGVTKLTSAVAGSNYNYGNPSLAAVSGNRALLAVDGGYPDDDIYYWVLDSNGDIVQYMTNVSTDGNDRWDYSPKAVELSDQRVLVAWPSGSYWLRYAVLDWISTSYARIAGPTLLANPGIVSSGTAYVSAAADTSGRGILTWMVHTWWSSSSLYYALVDSDGNVVTPPMIFYTSAATTPFVQSSTNGYGAAPLSNWVPLVNSVELRGIELNAP